MKKSVLFCMAVAFLVMLSSAAGAKTVLKVANAGPENPDIQVTVISAIIIGSKSFYIFKA
mgnify:CR=1 FL=1